jgi:hypothetical protein
VRQPLATLATGAFGVLLCLAVVAPALLPLARSTPQMATGPSATPPVPLPAATSVARAATVGTPATPNALATGPLTHGTIVIVRDTPHFWVADERGVLHWVSGTRALVGRYARWDAQRIVSAAELERFPRGEPWLLAPVGFVGGDGAELHVVTWHSGVTWPTLLRAPGLDALRPFGITAEHIQRHSTDRRTWERLLGLTVEDVATDLTPLTPSPLWTQGQWSGIGTQVSPPDTYEVRLAFSEARVDPELGVVIGTASYPSFPCSGYVGLLSHGIVQEEEEVLLAEWLNSGVESCTIQGRVTLTRRTDRRLFYTWSLPDRGMAVTGLLLRD